MTVQLREQLIGREKKVLMYGGKLEKGENREKNQKTPPIKCKKMNHRKSHQFPEKSIREERFSRVSNPVAWQLGPGAESANFFLDTFKITPNSITLTSTL